MYRSAKQAKNIYLSAVVGLTLAGCSTTPVVVRQGDKVDFSFTCRLEQGALVATTRPDSSVEGEVKAPVYLPRTGPDTVTATAGEIPPEAAAAGRVPFEPEIVNHLAMMLPGVQQGERKKWLLEADRYPVASAKEKLVRIARVRKRQKEMRLSKEDYTTRTGKAPEVGQPFVMDKMVPGKVTEVSEREVVIGFVPAPPEELTTPFGPVTAKEVGGNYELTIGAEKGRLIRTGPMVGRIVEVDDNSIGIDYGHPFGGEKLSCDVKVVKVERGVATKVGKQLEDALLTLQADKKSEAAARQPGTAASGDLAGANYTASLEDGTVFYTTRPDVAHDPGTKKVAWFPARKRYLPEVVPVGGKALLPRIGEALVGMSVGEKKHLSLSPEQAFGPRDPAKVQKLPLKRRLPRKVTVSAEEYVKRFDSFPVVGREVPVTPYFPGRVDAVRDREVDLVLLGQDGKSYSEPFGTTVIKIDSDSVTTTLTPVPGSSFPVANGYGVITSVDADSFTVDSNNPLAGKKVAIDLELASFTKAADIPGGLPWQEDHDAGLSSAKSQGKPALLVLYADWCGFCKRLFAETLPDPRIRALRDKVTWIKVNSDQLTQYKKLYGQDGYPMLVLFNADGSVAQKLNGYQDPSVLRAALQELL